MHGFKSHHSARNKHSQCVIVVMAPYAHVCGTSSMSSVSTLKSASHQRENYKCTVVIWQMFLIQDENIFPMLGFFMIRNRIDIMWVEAMLDIPLYLCSTVMTHQQDRCSKQVWQRCCGLNHQKKAVIVTLVYGEWHQNKWLYLILFVSSVVSHWLYSPVRSHLLFRLHSSLPALALSPTATGFLHSHMNSQDFIWHLQPVSIQVWLTGCFLCRQGNHQCKQVWRSATQLHIS